MGRHGVIARMVVTVICLATALPTIASEMLLSGEDLLPQADPASLPPGPPDPAARGHDPWRADLTLWSWMISVEGDQGVAGRVAQTSASFRDILRDSDSVLAFSGRVELAYQRWGLFVDGMYARLGADDVPTAPGFPDVDITYEMALVDFGAMYRLMDWQPGLAAVDNPHRPSLDLYAGGRYTDVGLDLDPSGRPTLHQGFDWIDPIVGAKLVLPLSRRFHIATNADIGGFGAGSDLTWSATAVLGYDFTLWDNPMSLYLGYRAIGQDYSSGSGADRVVWDVVQHGPLLGLSISF